VNFFIIDFPLSLVFSAVLSAAMLQSRFCDACSKMICRPMDAWLFRMAKRGGLAANLRQLNARPVVRSPATTAMGLYRGLSETSPAGSPTNTQPT
jgi:hypothetical protein